MPNAPTPKNLPEKPEEKVSFGFQDVPLREKTRKVLGVFNSVAQKYDLMNDLMSLGVHRLWKDDFIRELSPTPGMHLLDMAGGTGDISLRYLKKTRNMKPACRVTICDINQEMLNVGRAKLVDQGHLDRVEYMCSDAAKLTLPDNTFDAYTIAFGLRNVTEIEKALKEAYRVLKPGSRFLCLEFSKIGIPFLNKAYKKYSFKIIPKVGEMVAQDRESYKYLVESIEKFPDQETLVDMIKSAGFSYVKYRNLSGGIVAIHSGVKV